MRDVHFYLEHDKRLIYSLTDADFEIDDIYSEWFNSKYKIFELPTNPRNPIPLIVNAEQVKFITIIDLPEPASTEDTQNEL